VTSLTADRRGYTAIKTFTTEGTEEHRGNLELPLQSDL
jgi:hypothetical protein